MSRTNAQRMESVHEAVTRRDEFYERLSACEEDAVRCADMMAEAISMEHAARGHEVVGRDGRSFVCIEEIMAAHCAIKAREAYLKARGSNMPADGKEVK